MAEPESVTAMINDDHAATAPLDDFLAAFEADPNLWWRVASGHLLNLFEAALDKIEELEERLRTAEEMLQNLPEPD